MPDQIQVAIAGQITPLVLSSRGPALTDSDVAQLETAVRFKLPADYREFLLRYNGGYPVVGVVNGRDDDPQTPYAYGDAVSSFFQLPTQGGTVSEYSQLKVEAIGYLNLPPYALPIAEDGGGNCFVLELGPTSGCIRFVCHEHLEEPYESHRIVADSFLDLLLRIRTIEAEEALKKARAIIERQALALGRFPSKLEKQCAAVSHKAPAIRSWVRILTLRIFDAKGHFSIHDDENSFALLDLAFWLYENARPELRPSQRPEMATIIMSWWQEDDASFGLTGYAPGFLKDWWEHRLQSGLLIGSPEVAQLADHASAYLLQKWQALPPFKEA